MAANIRFWLFLLLLWVAAPALAQQVPNPMPKGFIVATNTELRATSTIAQQTVWRMGYHARGDAPPLAYAASLSACAINGGLGDNATEVVSADGKCWIAQPDTAGIDFRQFGAQPAALVDDALDAAIAYACRTHTTIRFPFQGRNEDQAWFLERAHVIGNGSAVANSTCNGVAFIADVQYQEYAQSQGTIFQWYGPAGVVPINVQGPMLSVTLRGIGIDCRNICATGIRISNVMDGEFGWLGVRRNVGPAFVITSEPVNVWNGAQEGSHFHNLIVALPGPGGSGADIGNTACTTCTVAVISNVFTNLTTTYDANTAGTYGLKLGFLTQATFVGGRFQRSDYPTTGTLGNSLIIAPPPGAMAFPQDVTFYHPMFDGPVSEGAGWAPTIGGIHFDSWSKTWTPFPVSAGGPGRLWGTDSAGAAFP